MCIDSTQVEQFEEAIRLGQAAVDSLRRAKAPAAERALAHYALGKALFEAGRRSATDRKSLLLDAVEHISQADSLIAKSPKNQFRVFGADATRSVVRARILTTLAVAVHKGVDHKLALFIYDHAGELLPFLSEQDNAATLRLRARWHADRGLSLAAGGSFDDLLDAGFGYSEGLAIVADSKNHYLTAVLHSNRADVLTQLGLFEDEINDRTAAIKALRRFSNRRRTANWFDNLVLNMSRRSFALVQLNRLEEAIHDTRLIEVLAPIEAKHQQLGISELIEIVLIAGADETRSIDSREALMRIAAKRLEHVLDTRSMDIGQLDFTLRAFTDLRHVRDDPRMQELLQQLHDLAHSSDAD
jgi:tetratricopeptide (TPR) repeat protein